MLPDARFHVRLALVTLLCAAGLGVLYLALADLQARVGYLAALLLGFAAFTWAAQAVAERIARAPDPGALLNYVMGLTGVKMLFGVGLVYGYKVYAQPPGLAFVWAFAWAYLVYTSFETYALVRLSFATAPKKTARADRDLPT